jgi:hypothetical protein
LRNRKLKSMAQRFVIRSFSTSLRCMSNYGEGAGKGGGSGGSIRDAGGAFGKMEAAREEEYFHKLQRAQIKSLKDQIHREVEHHEQQAKQHSDVIERHKRRIAELEQEEQNVLGKKK